MGIEDVAAQRQADAGAGGAPRRPEAEGLLLRALAVLDAWRYARPEAKAPRWLSRACKVALVLLVVRAD